MKRNNFIKNMGRIFLAAGLMATTLLSSCYKDTSPGAINFGKSPALIAWQYAGFQATPYTAVLLPQAGATLTTEITLSAPSVTLSSPVTATVVESSTALAASGAGPELPTVDYTLQNGGKVTIAPGQTTIKFVITFAGDKIDFSKNYALALVLTDANGAQIPTNLNTAIVILKVKSLFEGNYTVKSGATTRYNGGTVASGVRDQFAVSESSLFYSTYSANTVIGQAGSSAFGLTCALTFNGASVSVSADPSGTVGATTFDYINGDSKGQSSYDAATKTLTLHYSYLNAAGALREVDMVMVGPN